MRSLSPVVLGTALLAAGLASPLAFAEGSSESRAAKAKTAAEKPAASTTRSVDSGRPAAGAKKKGGAATTPASARPPGGGTRKVWTNADLVALRERPGSGVLVLETKDLGGEMPMIRTEPALRPQDVVDRYAQLAREAQTQLDLLEREKLAARNPFLRGLASQTGGPRSLPEIDAEVARWTSRRDAAQSNLQRATGLTGAVPTPPPEQPER